MPRPLPELVLGLVASELENDKQALRSLSLLSSSHVFPARQYLFRQVTIKLHVVRHNIDDLVTLLRDQPNISSCIRTLTLTQADGDRPTHPSLNLGTISQVVRNIPCLQTLHLLAVTWSTPTTSYEALTPHIHLNTLELSHVQGVTPLDNPLELLRLASHWRSVAIQNTACQQELLAPVQYLPSISTIRLHWPAYSRSWRLAPSQAKLLFANVKHVQLVVSFDRRDYEQLHAILAGIADSVQKLTLDILHRLYPHTEVWWRAALTPIEQCVALRAVEIHVPVDASQPQIAQGRAARRNMKRHIHAVGILTSVLSAAVSVLHIILDIKPSHHEHELSIKTAANLTFISPEFIDVFAERPELNCLAITLRVTHGVMPYWSQDEHRRLLCIPLGFSCLRGSLSDGHARLYRHDLIADAADNDLDVTFT